MGGCVSLHGGQRLAVVGAACRFADIENFEEFVALIGNGGRTVGEIPDSRVSLFPDSDLVASPEFVKFGAYLKDPTLFDAEVFGITENAARYMPPEARILLELTWSALEHAGLPPLSLSGTDTGVFVACAASEYHRLLRVADHPGSESAKMSMRGLIANRISNVFGLRGPSVVLDSAQSSGMAALGAAYQSLLNAEVSVALVCGANIILDASSTISLNRLGALSPSGCGMVLDSTADGYVRGEGGVVLVLKRYDDARRCGDRILGTIDGVSNTYESADTDLVSPSVAGQIRAMERLYSGGLDRRAVEYVEMHGTGTRVGDSVEARALGEFYGRARHADAPLAVGSVKANIGHLEGAAALAGVLKGLVCLQKGIIAGAPTRDRLRDDVDLPALNLAVQQESTLWSPSAGRRSLAVSSFGLGGSNGHALLSSDAEKLSNEQNSTYLATAAAV
ncbi:beta-ketoacyl [acyl carrier protein] synthase domain-containing protein, partial [Nocardia nova]|uniref:beta-ketoacyl [acyl carrier protein] synthase domain-containing protein n=1 Tax=Nocardia nova TaxID=37330 RepID=UPI001FD3F0FB